MARLRERRFGELGRDVAAEDGDQAGGTRCLGGAKPLNDLVTRQTEPVLRHDLGKNEIALSFDSQQYLMGYLPIVMLTLNAKYGVLPISNIYTGPNPVTSADVEKIVALSKKGIR